MASLSTCHLGLWLGWQILLNLVKPCLIYTYVDDSTIFEICNQSRASVTQDSANITAQWSSDNDMRINTNKTKEMVICFCKDRTYVESLPYIDINGTDIERVTQAKVLGVTISSDLRWNAHVGEIVAKARKRVYMIYQLKCAGINQNDLVRINVSVIRPAGVSNYISWFYIRECCADGKQTNATRPAQCDM